MNTPSTPPKRWISAEQWLRRVDEDETQWPIRSGKARAPPSTPEHQHQYLSDPRGHEMTIDPTTAPTDPIATPDPYGHLRPGDVDPYRGSPAPPCADMFGDSQNLCCTRDQHPAHWAHIASGMSGVIMALSVSGPSAAEPDPMSALRPGDPLTAAHRQARLLRALADHLDEHPHLPTVAQPFRLQGDELELRAPDGPDGLSAWARSIGATQLRVVAIKDKGWSAIYARGALRGAISVEVWSSVGWSSTTQETITVDELDRLAESGVGAPAGAVAR
ncbi:MAG: hypothetical protein ACRDTG_09745 [Pseudonocardiaceae bacterium]